MSTNITFFDSASGGGGSSSGDYIKDNFLDVSMPPNSNVGLSADTPTTNPMGVQFFNDDCPKYGAHTLYVKDLELVQDRSKWLNGKETWRIIWDQPVNGVYGFVCGNIRLKTQDRGTCIQIRNVDDFVGITSNVQKLAWIVNPSNQSAASANSTIDGAGTVSIDFKNEALDANGNGIPDYNVNIHSNSNATYDVHTYKLTAVQFGTLEFVGVVCYFEKDATQINCWPGTSFSDKTKSTVNSGTNLAIPANTSHLGSKNTIYKTSTTYAINTLSIPEISAVAVGASGTNSLTVDTGFGGSFPVGSGVAFYQGASTFISSVVNQATDTLTLGTTLSLGASSSLYKMWSAGQSLAISSTMFGLMESVDLFEARNFVDPSGFGKSGVGNYFYQDPKQRFRIWGSNLQYNGSDSFPGFQFYGATTGFLQVEGKFSALELELSNGGILHFTAAINGLPGYGINTGSTGYIKKTIFTDSYVGYNSAIISSGASMGAVTITKVNMYDYITGQTVCPLAEFSNPVTEIKRSVHNATLMSFGNWTRVFSDQLFLQGAWTRGLTTTVAGGAYYAGASTNSVLKFQYYGSDFAFIGTAGGSMLTLFDGASCSSAFNAPKGFTSVGFHTVTATWSAGATCVVNALDFLGSTLTPMTCVQNFNTKADEARIPTQYVQSDTPRNAKNGDMWFQGGNDNGAVWVKFFNRWYQLPYVNNMDDPNDQVYVKSHGASGVSATSDAEIFNSISWSISISGTAGRKYLTGGASQYNGKHHVIDGGPDDSTVNLFFNRFNKTSWDVPTNRTNASRTGGCGSFNGFLYVSMGYNGATWVNITDKWNGASWTSTTASPHTKDNVGSFIIGNQTINFPGGGNGSALNSVSVYNTSDSTSSGTVTPINGVGVSCNVNQNLGFLSFFGPSTITNTSYSSNGSAWSSSFSSAYSQSSESNGAGYFSSQGKAINSGGYNGSTQIYNSQTYNSVSAVSIANSILARSINAGACI